MTKLFSLFLSGFMVLGLAGCELDSSNDSDEPTAQLRVLHASPDAPNVDVLVDGDIAVTDAPYKAGTGYLTVPIMFDAKVNATGTDVTALDLSNTELMADTPYTVIAANVLASIEAIVLDDSYTAPADGNLTVRVVHASAVAPTVDIYITAPDAVLADSTPVATAAFKDASEFLEVPAADYRIRVTAENDSTVLFDSGTIALAEGLALTVVAVPSENVIAPIDLIALTGDSENPTLEINDNRAQLRVAHLSPDAPNVDVYVDGGLTLADVPFKAVSDYLLVAGGAYDITITATGDTTPVLEVEALALEALSSYTAAAVNVVSEIEALPIVDDLTAPAAGNAKVRVAHASPDAPEVDILVNDVVTLEDIPFKAISEYLEVPAGDYNFKVNVADTTTTVIDANVTLEDGRIYTVHAVDEVAEIEALVTEDN